jgi:hypothetical protein
MPTTTTSSGTIYSIVVSSTISPGYTPVSPYTTTFTNTTNSAITVNSSSSSRIQKDIYLSPQNYGNLFLLAQSSTSNTTYAEGGLTFTQTASTTQFPLNFNGTTFSLQTSNGLTIDILNLDIWSTPFVIQFYDSDLNSALVSDVFTVVNGSTISVNSGYYLQIQQANFTLTNGYGVVEGATNSLYTTSFTTYINSYSNTVASGTCKQDSAGNYYLNVTSSTSSTSLPLVFQFNTTISSIVLGATGYPSTTDSDLPLVPFLNPILTDCSLFEATSYVGTLQWSNATPVTSGIQIPSCLVNLPSLFGLLIETSYKLSSFSFTPTNGEDGPSSSNNYNLDSSIVIENIYGYFYEATSTFIMILEDSNNNVYYFLVTTN